ncbi:MAG: metal-dependent hydrolase [Candidatus Micrarchaeota archaeon]
MDLLFHFLFTLMALYAARVHVKQHKLMPLFFALVTIIPDLDHFFGMSARTTLHNVFITGVIPLALVGIAMLNEKKGVFWKQFTILLFIVLISHPILDLFSEANVMLFYPVSSAPVSLSNFALTTHILGRENLIASSSSIGLLVFWLLLSFASFIDELVEIEDRTHKGARWALGVIREQMKSWIKEA